MEATFTTPAWVLKDGVPVVRDGRVIATPVGGTHYATPGFDSSVARLIDDNTDAYMRPHRHPGVIGTDELCNCSNGGRLLPAACFPKSL
jgi:formylmethanofuran dehydrogenase subunit A